MRIDRRAFLVATLGAAACRSRPVSDEPPARAARFLWSRQGPDGGFHSETYGLLRSGQSLTPFVLGALLDVPETHAERPRGAIGKALGFIRSHTNAAGELGRMDASSADYPNYATALAVRALVRIRRDDPGAIDAREIDRMTAALGRQQFAEENGWSPGDAPYGAWGMGGPVRRPPDPGHVDLSMTRFVLEALAHGGVEPSGPAMECALVYLEKSQNTDGGFCFSLVNDETNKAGEDAGLFPSYGTATADGVLALRAAGVADSDGRVRRALDWLRTHHRPESVPGFDRPPYETWATGLRFYYAAAVSAAVPELMVDLPPQGADGSFRNPNSIVKEDDPLIATTFALNALLRADGAGM